MISMTGGRGWIGARVEESRFCHHMPPSGISGTSGNASERWISVTERLPAVRAMVHYKTALYRYRGSLNEAGEWIDYKGIKEPEEVVAWMPVD